MRRYTNTRLPLPLPNAPMIFFRSRNFRKMMMMMMYRYSAYSPYLALSHSITAHQEKAMLYACDYDEDECAYQCFAKVTLHCVFYCVAYSIVFFVLFGLVLSVPSVL